MDANLINDDFAEMQIVSIHAPVMDAKTYKASDSDNYRFQSTRP